MPVIGIEERPSSAIRLHVAIDGEEFLSHLDDISSGSGAGLLLENLSAAFLGLPSYLFSFLLIPQVHFLCSLEDGADEFPFVFSGVDDQNVSFRGSQGIGGLVSYFEIGILRIAQSGDDLVVLGIRPDEIVIGFASLRIFQEFQSQSQKEILPGASLITHLDLTEREFERIGGERDIDASSYRIIDSFLDEREMGDTCDIRIRALQRGYEEYDR